MKRRVVDIEVQDPLAVATEKAWSAKEHQEAMAAEAARISAGKRAGKKAAPGDAAGEAAREEATLAVLSAAAREANKSVAPAAPQAAAATPASSASTAPPPGGNAATPAGSDTAEAATSAAPTPGDGSPAAAPTASATTKIRKVKHAPLPSVRGPTAQQKRLLVKGMKPLHVVEAALFSAGKPISTEDIANETGLDQKAVLAAIKELSKLYDERDTVLEVGKAGTKWGMQVRSQAAEPAARFAPMEIAPKLLKTLALIAYHQPMKQSDLVDMVGTKAYDHVPELVERGLVRAREEGSTKTLVTTPQFPEYFGIDAASTDDVRNAMAKLVGLPPREPAPSATMVESEIQAQAASAASEEDVAAAPETQEDA